MTDANSNDGGVATAEDPKGKKKAQPKAISPQGPIESVTVKVNTGQKKDKAADPEQPLSQRLGFLKGAAKGQKIQCERLPGSGIDSKGVYRPLNAAGKPGKPRRVGVGIAGMLPGDLNDPEVFLNRLVDEWGGGTWCVRLLGERNGQVTVLEEQTFTHGAPPKVLFQEDVEDEDEDEDPADDPEVRAYLDHELQKRMGPGHWGVDPMTGQPKWFGSGPPTPMPATFMKGPPPLGEGHYAASKGIVPPEAAMELKLLKDEKARTEREKELAKTDQKFDRLEQAITRLAEAQAAPRGPAENPLKDWIQLMAQERSAREVREAAEQQRREAREAAELARRETERREEIQKEKDRLERLEALRKEEREAQRAHELKLAELQKEATAKLLSQAPTEEKFLAKLEVMKNLFAPKDAVGFEQHFNAALQVAERVNDLRGGSAPPREEEDEGSLASILKNLLPVAVEAWQSRNDPQAGAEPEQAQAQVQQQPAPQKPKLKPLQITKNEDPVAAKTRQRGVILDQIVAMANSGTHPEHAVVAVVSYCRGLDEARPGHLDLLREFMDETIESLTMKITTTPPAVLPPGMREQVGRVKALLEREGGKEWVGGFLQVLQRILNPGAAQAQEGGEGEAEEETGDTTE